MIEELNSCVSPLLVHQTVHDTEAIPEPPVALCAYSGSETVSLSQNGDEIILDWGTISELFKAIKRIISDAREEVEG